MVYILSETLLWMIETSVPTTATALTPSMFESGSRRVVNLSVPGNCATNNPSECSEAWSASVDYSYFVALQMVYSGPFDNSDRRLYFLTKHVADDTKNMYLRLE